MVATSLMSRINKTYRRVRKELSENVILLFALWLVTRPIEDLVTKNINMLFDEIGIPAARTFFQPYGLIGTIVVVIILLVFIHAYIDTLRHEDGKEDDPIKSIERRVSFIEDNAATKCDLAYEQQNRVAATDGLAERLNRTITKLETLGFQEEKKEQKSVPAAKASLPLCPGEIVFDPSNEVYRKWIEEENPLGEMFGKSRRKIWSFAIWNEPPSSDLTSVAVCVDTVETIPSKPGGLAQHGTKHYGAKLRYENGSTEKDFPPGHRELIPFCSSVMGTDRIRIEGTGTVFQYHGGSHNLRVVITCSGHKQEERTFKVWIDDAGALQVELERETPMVAALKAHIKRT